MVAETQAHTTTIEHTLNTMVAEKKIIDQVSGWLTMFDDGSVDRTWRGPPQFKFMAEPVRSHEHFIDRVATRDVTIDPDTDSRVRIYLPETTSVSKLPVILHFHGGGFCISQADWYMYYNFYTNLARTAQAVIVSVYHRPAPEHRLPAAIDDGYAALLWLQSLAQNQSHEPWLHSHADFSRVFLIGDSSGGNIVHHVAALAGKNDITPLKLSGAIPIHPGFVRSERSKSELEQPQSPMLTLDMLDKFLSLALPEGSNKDHPITCPMGAAMDDIILPAVLLCVAEKDLIKDTEMEYYEGLKKGNKKVELLISEGVGHSFYLNKVAVDMDPQTTKQTDKLIHGITHFIKNH